MNEAAPARPSETPTRVTARALTVGERIDTAGLERPDMISSLPLAFRVGPTGMVALFRFGVAVMVGLTPLEEEDTLAKLKSRVIGARARGDDETAVFEIAPEGETPSEGGGPIRIKDLSPPRFLVMADALAKTVALARDEREVNAVFDVIEPFAFQLAHSGRPPFRRRAMLRLIGQALLAQHRVSGRVAVEEKPDVLWDRPDLERLYARLEDEYELKERAGALKRKLDVIVETAHALTDIIDADRATRLEATIVVLIIAELVASVIQIALAWRGH
ncbi:MAG TPA: RMD1 family protein [Roseiarcus sp.]|nr:RMD1 family protein [Roseiarcus sp.]